jgi:hypothetical protein
MKKMVKTWEENEGNKRLLLLLLPESITKLLTWVGIYLAFCVDSVES